MKISFAPFSYILLISIPALSVLGLITVSYKHFMSVLPQYLDLKIPFYYFFLFYLFLSNLIIFWKFHFFKKIQTISLKTIFIPPFLLLIPLIIGLRYIHFFVSVQYKDIGFIQDLRDVGITPQDFVATPILIGIFIAYGIFFLWSVRKNDYFSKAGFLYFILSVSITILLAFHYGYLNTYDYSYWAGPVNDVLHGKFLLLEAHAQYGFLSVLFLSAIFHFISLGLANIVLVNAILVTLQFIALSFILPSIIKNKWLALLALVTAIFANYIIQIFPPGTFPQTNALRFGSWIIILLLLLLKEKGTETIKKIVGSMIPVLIGFFLFWEFDSGIYLLFAYLSFVLVTNLDSSFLKTISKIIAPFLEVFFSIALIFLLINLYYVVFLGKFPNWAFFVADPAYYLISGFSFVPLSNSLWHKIIFAVYLINFLFVATKVKFYPQFIKDGANKLFIFTLFWGIFHLTYYLGRSHLNNLHHIIIPFVVCLFYDFDRFLQLLRNQKSFYLKLLGISNVAIFLVLPTYFFFTQGVTNLPTSNFFSGIHNVVVRKQIEDNAIRGVVGNTIDLLKSKYGSYIYQNGITLVSWEDAWYLIALNMKNNIDSNNLKYFIREEEVHALSQQILNNKYKYVFIDSYRPVGFVSINQASIIFKDIQPYYEFKEMLDHLVVLEIKSEINN